MGRIFTVLAFGAVVVACSEQATSPQPGTSATAPMPSLAATSGWTEQVLDAPVGDYTWYAPCIDDILDEVGPILLRYHTVANNNGSLLVMQVRFLDGFHLVGDRTGIWNPVVPNQGGTETERSSGENGSFTLHYTLTPYLFVNEVSGTKMSNPFRAKFTINANGEVKVARETEPCNIVGQ